MVENRRPRVEAGAARLVGIDPDHLGRSHLSQRRRGSRGVSLVHRSDERLGALEAAAVRRQPADSQTEHVLALAGDRRRPRVGDDGYGHPESVRFRRQRAVGARHPARLRPVRAALRLRFVATAVRGFPLRAGPARIAYRRALVPPAHPQVGRADDLAGRAPHVSRAGIAGCLHDTDAGASRWDGGSRGVRRGRGHRP